MYDIIGDIHGYADELKHLLRELGYVETQSGYRHSQRKAIFCGDFIDRGPQIPEVVRIVRAMCESGDATAVMGNHEFNALAFHTQDPDHPGQFLRPHTTHNVKQHSATLQQFAADELREALAWFRTLPVAIETSEYRIVHACWNPDCIDTINAHNLEDDPFNAQFLKRAVTVHDPVFEAIECVLKGPELPLPNGLTVNDKEGKARRRIRIRWFRSPHGQTWSTYALPAASFLPDEPVPTDAFACPYDENERPVFVGHYWLRNYPPSPLTRNVACLDYSVACDGWLCAYRFDGQLPLTADRFVAVPCRTRMASQLEGFQAGSSHAE